MKLPSYNEEWYWKTGPLDVDLFHHFYLLTFPPQGCLPWYDNQRSKDLAYARLDAIHRVCIVRENGWWAEYMRNANGKKHGLFRHICGDHFVWYWYYDGDLRAEMHSTKSWYRRNNTWKRDPNGVFRDFPDVYSPNYK